MCPAWKKIREKNKLTFPNVSPQDSDTLLPVGFIGLGKMGGGMLENLLSKGVSVHIYDKQESLKSYYKKKGAKVHNSPAEVSQKVECIFLCLPFTPQVSKVLFGEDGISSTASKGLTVIDASTILYKDALKFRKKLRKSRIEYCDCPISGLPKRAKEGSLTMMFGGPKQVYERILPYLMLMGDFIIYSGKCGSGQLMKALNNVVYNINIAAISETLPVAVKLGLDPKKLAKLFTSASSRSFASEHFIPKMLSRDFLGDYSMNLAYKDIQNVRDATADFSSAMPVFNSMVQTYEEAIKTGLGDESKNAMLKVYERKLGLKIK